MIDFIFAVLAIAAAANPATDEAGPAGVQGNVVTEAEGFTAPVGLQAEPQTASGRFTTATEVKPILTATKTSWIAVRDYGGNDLLYLTHLWSWRCGLEAMAIAVNDGPVQEVPLPACHTEFATPNAILEQDGLPFLTYPQNSITQVTVHIIYDDLTRDSAVFSRSDVLIP